MNIRFLKTTLPVLLLLICGALAANDHLESRQLVKEGAILPLETILQRVNEQRPGKVLEVEQEFEKGRYIYEIELLGEDGIVWEMEIDAVTGEILELEEED